MRTYKILTFLLLFCSVSTFGQNTVGVTLSLGAPIGGFKKVTVSYVANGAFVAANASDDWGTQVITLGWKPSTGLLASGGVPSTQISSFNANSGFLPFLGMFTNGSGIIAYTLGQVGGSNDGNVYTSFTVNTPTADKPLANGSITEVFSFNIPASLGTTDVTELFLLPTQPSGPSLNLKPTILNSFYGGGANSIWDMVNVSIPLPIKITTFSAEQYESSSSKLDWTTSSEENSDFFGIERSEDGVNWSAIGKVRAAGNSSGTLKYQFIDSNLPMNRSKNQIFYYRLRMTDLDGKFEYSDIRGVNFSRSFAQGIEIYPNPATEMLNVDLTGFDVSAGEVDLSVYDMTSKKLIGKKVIGSGIELIDISNIPGGTYQISIIQGSTQFKKNFIKLR